MEGFLRQEGIEVVRWPLVEPVSGIFVRAPRAVIAVNAAHQRTRQRFTMAHEFYHYLYHRSLKRLMCMTDLADTSRREREANRFAACLLMPEASVRIVLSRSGFAGTAARLMVSPEALQWRLRELGLQAGMMA